LAEKSRSELLGRRGIGHRRSAAPRGEGLRRNIYALIERKKAPPTDGSRNALGAVKKKAPLPKRGAEDHRLAVPSETTLPREKEVARQPE